MVKYILRCSKCKKQTLHEISKIIQKKVSEVSDCQYNEDKIREILSDTSLTTDTFEKNKRRGVAPP